MNNIVTIKLDPINAGIIGNIESMKSTAGAFVIMGTNSEYKVISPEEYLKYLEDMRESVHQMIIGDYMLIFDDKKVFEEAGYGYFIGSFLLTKCSEKYPSAMVRMAEYEIIEAIECIEDYFAELVINGERVDALMVGN